MSACPYCGWPDDQPAHTVSQHPTAEGMTLWTRCACGSLQLRQLTAGAVRVTVRGRPADPLPGRSPAERSGTSAERSGAASQPENEGCLGPLGG